MSIRRGSRAVFQRVPWVSLRGSEAREQHARGLNLLSIWFDAAPLAWGFDDSLHVFGESLASYLLSCSFSLAVPGYAMESRLTLLGTFRLSFVRTPDVNDVS